MEQRNKRKLVYIRRGSTFLGTLVIATTLNLTGVVTYLWPQYILIRFRPPIRFISLNRAPSLFTIDRSANGKWREVEPQDWFVGPDGKPTNQGTKVRPLDLTTALKGEKTKPGDRLWLEKGVYKGSFVSMLVGTEERPIIVRAEKGKRVTIDGNLTVQGAHTWIWGLEVTNSDSNRTRDRPGGVTCFGLGTRLINLVVHDCGAGIGFWSPVQDGNVYGCIIYHNGWQGEGNDRGHGHAIYTQNEVGTKRLVDNIMFDQYGWGIHAYTKQGSLNGFHIEGNIIFNNGSPTRQNARYENILVGGHKPAERVTILNNCTYHTPELGGNNVRLHYAAANNKDLMCQFNYFMGGSTVLSVRDWEKVVMKGNTVWGKNILINLTLPPGVETSAYEWNQNTAIAGESAAPFGFVGAKSFTDWKRATGFDDQSTLVATPAKRPTGLKVFNRVNQYEPERIHLAVYNWEKKKAVKLDLSGVLKKGERFKVLAVQDYFGSPVIEAVYKSRPIKLPMMRIPTGPEFGAFVLEKVSKIQ